MRIQKQSLKALEECLAVGIEPPEMFLAGHCHHEALIHDYYKMFIMSLPCFQGQTPYLVERGMISQLGGVVLEYQDDMLSSPRVDYRQYKQIADDYPSWRNAHDT
jgi:hypothetical protein